MRVLRGEPPPRDVAPLASPRQIVYGRQGRQRRGGLEHDGGGTMILRALWRGELPLAQAFWSHALLYSGLASLTATVAAFGMISQGLPTALAAGVYFLPTPYILTALVGTWRSADRHDGPVWQAQAARLASLVWATAMILA